MATRKQEKQAEDEGAFKDVTSAQETVEESEPAQALRAPDDEGEPQSDEEREAVETLADENARRAAGTGEGGGPWPQELLAKRGTTAGRVLPDAPEYTSHLEREDQ